MSIVKTIHINDVKKTLICQMGTPLSDKEMKEGLKTLEKEGMIKLDPDNEHLVHFTEKGYEAYKKVLEVE